jgi:ubiquinone/menaquinone biosynthesis C-methylase UbiE
MADEYDRITSFHYSTYRPPLHNPILDKCIPNNHTYDTGLDLGCGTGQSSIALTSYCQEVIGLEPSKHMLKKSINHDKVKYHMFNGTDLDISKDLLDIITFAGSLDYAKSQRLLDEVIRVSKRNAKIVIYDFEINLDSIMMKLAGRSAEANDQKYNHEEDFSGLSQKNIQKERSSKNEVFLKVSNGEILHLLLATKDKYLILLEKFGRKSQLDTKISAALDIVMPLKIHDLKVKIFYAVYRVLK